MIKTVKHDRVKYGTKSCGGRARQRRDRESVCERERASLKMIDSVGNKFDHPRKYLWQMWEDNLRQSR
jgi:hypothetical protein